MRISVVFIFVFINIMPIAASHKKHIYVESIKQIKEKISSSNDIKEKISLIDKLIVEDVSSMNSSYWHKQKISLADSINDRETKLRAISGLTRVYMKKLEEDSLLLCIDAINKDKEINGYTDHYFKAHTYKCFIYVTKRHYTKAMLLAQKLMDESQAQSNAMGIIGYYKINGVVNTVSDNLEEAISTYERAIQFCDDNSVESSAKTQLYMYLMMVTAKNDADQHRDVLTRYSTYLNSERSKNKYDYNYGKADWYEAYYYMKYYISCNMADSAGFFMSKAEDMIRQNPDFNTANFEIQKALYYLITKNFADAHDVADKYLKRAKRNEPSLTLKGRIFYEQGLYEEAFYLYKDVLVELQESENKILEQENIVKREEDELHNIKMNLNKQELRYQKSRAMNIKIILTVVIILFIVIVGLLYKEIKYRIRISESARRLNKEKQELELNKSDLERLLQIASEDNKKKTRFLTIMNHEIRTPLNAIVGFSQIIAAENNCNDQIKQFGEIIQNNSELLLRLVGDVVEQSTAESEALSIDIASHDVIAAANSVLQSIKNLANDDVEVAFSPFQKQFYLDTDIIRVQQVVTNLLGNSLKFTNKGKIDLSIYPDENYIVFAVTDTGCGIPQEKQEKIFGRFEKLNESAFGTGIGLSICKSIADKLGALLYVDSEYNSGARIIFKHPVNITL